MRLLTIPMSHYCEKARWGLAHAGIDYVEEAHLQLFHYAAVRRHGVDGKVPVLVCADGVVTDSTAILQFLDTRLPEPRRLYPEALRAEVEALEEEFDERLGVETRRWVYYHWMQRPPREVLATAAQNIPPWQRGVAPLLFPLFRRYLAQKLAISAAGVQQGLGVIEQAFEAVAVRLADGRPYLCGGRFTAADLGFACMASPVLLPPEYGIRLPPPEQAPPQARADVDRFRQHPAGQFALRMFRNHRSEQTTTPTV